MPGKQGLEEGLHEDALTQYLPMLAQVVESATHTVCHAIPFAEHAVHFGQHFTTPKEFLAKYTEKTGD